DERLTPVQVTGLNNITMVGCGYFNNIALKSDGTVWIWGQNIDSGGTVININTPTQVSGLNNVTSIACGDQNYFALKNDGTVWAWGRNGASQLGDGTNVYKYSPVQISNLNGSTILYSKYIHSFAQKADGTVWAWGLNTSSQLGDGTATTRDVPISIEFGIEPPPTTDEDTPYSTTYNITDAESGTCGLIITMASSDPNLFTDSNFTYSCNADIYTLSLTPTEDLFGVATITVIGTDPGGLTASDSFALTVTSVEDAPIISSDTTLTMNEDTSASFTLTATDAETADCSIDFTYASSDTTLLPLENISYTCTSGIYYLTITPTANLSGNATLTLTVTDGGGLTATEALSITVTGINDAPLIGVMNQTAAGEISFTFVEADDDTVSFTATSSDQSLISDSNIRIIGASGNSTSLTTISEVAQSVSIQLTQESNVHGLATITVIAGSVGSTVTNTFNLIVSPPGAGNALQFDGTDDYVNLGNSSALKPTSAFTYEIWVYHSDWTNAASEKILSNVQSGGYALSIQSDIIELEAYINGSYACANFSKSSLTSGWHHLALSFDGRYLKSYLDGETRAENDLGGTYTVS
ncbi:hypothetical protein MHK_009187, partial [Candidatus Magnetomorum sp. HK-1]